MTTFCGPLAPTNNTCSVSLFNKEIAGSYSLGLALRGSFDGTIATPTGFVVESFTVEPNTTYMVNRNVRVALYDASGAWTGVVNLLGGQKFTTGANIVSAKASAHVRYFSELVIHKDHIPFFEDHCGRVSPLAGEKIAFLGDSNLSLSGRQVKLPEILGTLMGGVDIINLAVGGASYAVRGTSPTLAQQVSNIPPNVDKVFVMLGGADALANNGSPLGNLGDTNDSTFTGGAYQNINDLVNLVGADNVFVSWTIDADDNDDYYATYADRLKAVSESLNVNYINPSEVSDLRAGGTNNPYYLDNRHGTEAGFAKASLDFLWCFLEQKKTSEFKDMTYQSAKCGCNKNPCHCPPEPKCCPERANVSSTVVHRHTQINNYGTNHRPHHRGYVEHHHCGEHKSGCGCHEKQLAKAACLDSTLACVEKITTDGDTVTQTKINEGVVGQVLAHFNGQFYDVPAGAIVTITMVGNAVAGTCGLHVLNINGVAVNQANVHAEAFEPAGCPCTTMKVSQEFTQEEASVICDAEVEFQVLS